MPSENFSCDEYNIDHQQAMNTTWTISSMQRKGIFASDSASPARQTGMHTIIVTDLTREDTHYDMPT